MKKKGSALASKTTVMSKTDADAEQIRVRVMELRDAMTDNYFELGQLLYHISKSNMYRKWRGPDGEPYQKFSAYVEHEVAFAFRKAKYLMSIWWWFAEKLADPKVSERIREVGWNKAALLVGIVDSQNVDVWIEKAMKLGVKQLNEECKVALVAADKSRRPARNKSVKEQPKTTVDGQPSTKGAALPFPLPASGAPEQARMGVDPLSEDEVREFRHPWRILLTGEQNKNVELAIDRASEIAEVEADGKGFLLDFIATSFLAVYGGTSGHNNKQHQVNFRNEVLRAAEQSLGVDIVAFDKGSSRPLFGAETIDRILEEGGGNAD